MDLLGDFLLFSLGPNEGPLLFGTSSQPYSLRHHAPDILTYDEQAADDDEVAAALIAILCQVPP
jgi:hypothetical protein